MSVNPLNRNIIYRDVHFNTKFRDSYETTSSTNFVFSLSNSLDKVTSIKLSSLSIPKTSYLVTAEKKNNSFIAEYVTPTNIIRKKVTINDGNYTPAQMEAEIRAKILTAMPYYYYLSITINDSSKKTSIDTNVSLPGTMASTTSTYFNIIFCEENNDKMKTLGWLLGFRKEKYTNINTIADSSSEVISEGLYDEIGEDHIFFCLNDYNRNSTSNQLVYLNNNTSIVSGVLAKVYLKDGKYIVNLDQNEDNIINYSRTRQFFGPVTIKKIGISILDEYGNEINLNNMDYSFTIEVSQLYSACV